MFKPLFHLMAKPSSFHCNIQCEYCFYLGKEQDFGKRAYMSEHTLKNYIRQYIESHGGERVEFAWQGGEPTLLGLDFFKSAVKFQQEFANGKTISNAFQTNGIALNSQWAAFFREQQFLVGLSIDGLSAVHNRYRLSSSGQPTFERVLRALELLQQYQVEFNTLTVVNDQNWHKGKETYQALKALGSRFMQFIPIVETDLSGKTTDYSVPPEGFGRFLIDVLLEWQKADQGRIFVLEFDNLLGQWLGYPSASCIFQRSCGKSLVVEANGDVYSCDHFVYPQHQIGNLNQQDLGELVCSKQQRDFGLAKYLGLSSACKGCPYLSLCHGGCPKHRIVPLANGEKHNYLCPSYQYFFRHSAPFMQARAAEIKG